MNRAEAILGALRVAGAEVGLDGGRLRVRAAAGAVASNLRASVAKERDGIVALLTAEESATALPVRRERIAASGATHVTPAGTSTATADKTDRDEIDLEQHVANALALTSEERAAWRHEVVHALVWAEAGRGQDAHVAADLRALRRVVVPGTCLRCGASVSADGRFWCDRCFDEYPKTTGVNQ